MNVLIIESQDGVQRATVDAVKEALRKDPPRIDTAADLIEATAMLGCHSFWYDIVICAETVFHSEGGFVRGSGLEYMQGFRVNEDRRLFVILAETDKPQESGFLSVKRRLNEPRTFKLELRTLLRSQYPE